MAIAFAPEFQEQFQTAVENNDHKEALLLAKQIADDLQSNAVAEIDVPKVKRIEAQLWAVAMRHLSKQMLIDLFELYPATVAQLPDEIDIIENFKDRLYEEVAVEDKNSLRDKVRTALERSEEVLGNPIKLGNETVTATVSNWLKLYTTEVGAGQPTTIKLARFFAQNPNVLKLTETERSVLRKLVYFYAFLRLRSDQLEGFDGLMMIEDENGMTQVIENGKVEPLYTKADLEQYKEQARNGTIDRPLLWSLMTKFPDQFQQFSKLKNEPVALSATDPKKVQQQTEEFFARQSQSYAKLMRVSGVPLPDRTAALVAMLHKAMSRGQEADLILCREILQKVVSDQDRYINFMRHTSIIQLIQDQFPQSMGEKNKPVAKQSPGSPMALQALLAIVFSKFNISAEEALWHAFEVLQKVPLDLRELKTVATYDIRQNKLVWRY